jgi:hypothetical protein
VEGDEQIDDRLIAARREPGLLNRFPASRRNLTDPVCIELTVAAVVQRDSAHESVEGQRRAPELVVSPGEGDRSRETCVLRLRKDHRASLRTEHG